MAKKRTIARTYLGQNRLKAARRVTIAGADLVRRTVLKRKQTWGT